MKTTNKPQTKTIKYHKNTSKQPTNPTQNNPYYYKETILDIVDNQGKPITVPISFLINTDIYPQIMQETSNKFIKQYLSVEETKKINAGIKKYTVTKSNVNQNTNNNVNQNTNNSVNQKTNNSVKEINFNLKIKKINFSQTNIPIIPLSYIYKNTVSLSDYIQIINKNYYNLSPSLISSSLKRKLKKFKKQIMNHHTSKHKSKFLNRKHTNYTSSQDSIQETPSLTLLKMPAKLQKWITNFIDSYSSINTKTSTDEIFIEPIPEHITEIKQTIHNISSASSITNNKLKKYIKTHNLTALYNNLNHLSKEYKQQLIGNIYTETLTYRPIITSYSLIDRTDIINIPVIPHYRKSSSQNSRHTHIAIYYHHPHTYNRYLVISSIQYSNNSQTQISIKPLILLYDNISFIKKLYTIIFKQPVNKLIKNLKNTFATIQLYILAITHSYVEQAARKEYLNNGIQSANNFRRTLQMTFIFMSYSQDTKSANTGKQLLRLFEKHAQDSFFPAKHLISLLLSHFITPHILINNSYFSTVINFI